MNPRGLGLVSHCSRGPTPARSRSAAPRLARAAGAIVGVVLAIASLGAHHSFAMFDMGRTVEYRGVVTEWMWKNPHVHFTVLVKPGSGVDKKMVGTWDVEGGSIHIMMRQGWTLDSYKIGDPIRLVGHPRKDGSKGMSLFYAIRRDGSRLYNDIERPQEDVKKQ
jgi:hypothetical protein